MRTNNGETSNTLKLVVVGNEAVGKTCLLGCYNGRNFYCRTAYGYQEKIIELDGETITFVLLDTTCYNDFDRLRPLAYPNSHVLLLLSAIDSKHQLSCVEKSWQPELNHHCPGVPVILVGSKVDLKDENSVSFEEGQRMAEKIGAVKYMECSALENVGVEKVFEEAARTGLKYQNMLSKLKKRTCSML